MSGEINRRIREIQANSSPEKMAAFAHDHLVKITPKDTGNAKNKTTLNKDEVHANYAYAKRLDENWSKQTKGKGLIQPTLDAVVGYIDKI